MVGIAIRQLYAAPIEIFKEVTEAELKFLISIEDSIWNAGAQKDEVPWLEIRIIDTTTIGECRRIELLEGSLRTIGEGGEDS